MCKINLLFQYPRIEVIIIFTILKKKTFNSFGKKSLQKKAMENSLKFSYNMRNDICHCFISFVRIVYNRAGGSEATL
jgi:hypothetical protein